MTARTSKSPRPAKMTAAKAQALAALQAALDEHEVASRQAVSWIVTAKDLAGRWTELGLSPGDFHSGVRDIAQAASAALAGNPPLVALAQVAGEGLAWRAAEIATQDQYLHCPAGVRAYGLRHARLKVDLARANVDGDLIRSGELARELADLEAAGRVPASRQLVEIITGGEVLGMSFPDQPLVGGLLEEKESLLVCGPSGLGKSVLTFNLALTLAVAPAAGMWGLFPVPRPLRSVFLQSENSGKAMQARLRSITDAAPELRPGLDGLFFPKIGADCRTTGTLGDAAFQARTVEILRAVQADLLVLDPLISFHGADENDNAAMRRSLDALTAICDAAGVACVVVHHVGKAGSDNAVFAGRGASAIGDWAANILLMCPVADEAGNRTPTIEMRHVKARNFEAQSPFFLERQADLTMLRTDDPRDREGRERCAAVVDCLRGLGGKVDSKLALETALAESMGASRGTARRAIGEAQKRGYLRFFPGKGKREGISLATLFNRA